LEPFLRVSLSFVAPMSVLGTARALDLGTGQDYADESPRMSGATESFDKLRALRVQLESAVTPAARVNATMLLVEELWLSDPAAARPLLEQLVVEAEAAGDGRVWGRATTMLSELLRQAGDLDGSARHAELALKRADATGNRQDRACGLNLVGMIHQERGELRRALKCFGEFLQISREIGFGRGEQSALNQLAGVYGLQGDLDKALKCYREALELSTKAGDSHGRAIHHHNIGWALQSMGRWAEATEYFHRAIALCEEHGYRDQLLDARMALGELSLMRSDCENAARMFRAVIEAEREARSSGRQVREALSNLGWTFYRSGDLAQAEETLEEAAQQAEAAEDRFEQASIGLRRAELAVAQGWLDRAGSLLAQAARHAADLNLRKERGEALRVEALLFAARAQTGPAIELFVKSEATLEPLGDTYELAMTRLQRSRLLLDLGRSEEALPLLQASARTFRRLSVVAEAEEANRLLYRLEALTNRDSALLQELLSIRALDLAPERFVERALALLCESLRFEQGAVLVGDRPVALRGQPDLAELPGQRSSLSQTDVALIVPVSQDRCILGCVWLRRAVPLTTRVEAGLLELVSYMLAPFLAKLVELEMIEARRAPDIPGLRYRGLVGSNREVLELMALVPRVAAAGVPVLVRGESGSGKELIARALHESGPRADKPFVTVNCAAVPESLLEAEFFGVEQGAATGVAPRLGKFELAGSGTVFLDEIGDMSPALQAKLLRAIEDGAVTRVGGSRETKVDVRVIAATNMDLDLRERQGLFRRDLLYRLNTVQFVLPPLRQRREDVPALAQYFIARSAQKYGRNVRQSSAEVLALFVEYHWPGNIRQLQHVVERAVILAAGDTLQMADLPPEIRQSAGVPTIGPVPATRDERRRVTADVERAMLIEALARAHGKATEAAKLIGYSRTHFYRLLQKHKITRPN
jgi:DNA-binding NtrC family response regulator/tetratricopeptide (TPR) repeat protein